MSPSSIRPGWGRVDADRLGAAEVGSEDVVGQRRESFGWHPFDQRPFVAGDQPESTTTVPSSSAASRPTATTRSGRSAINAFSSLTPLAWSQGSRVSGAAIQQRVDLGLEHARAEAARL